ncbi:hypothetical protein KEM52_005183, partial [Ascosphaera acerosa]
MSADGEARVRGKAEAEASPAKRAGLHLRRLSKAADSIATNSLPAVTPARPPLRRSASASFTTATATTGTRTGSSYSYSYSYATPLTALSGSLSFSRSFGRSRDSKLWEMSCDQEARSAVKGQAATPL